MRSWPGNGERKPSGTPASLNWDGICAKSGRVNTGGWRISSPSMGFWRGLPGIEAESLLPDVDPRALAAAGAERTERSGMDEGVGASEAGAEGQAGVRLCNLVAQSS